MLSDSKNTWFYEKIFSQVKEYYNLPVFRYFRRSLIYLTIRRKQLNFVNPLRSIPSVSQSCNLDIKSITIIPFFESGLNFRFSDIFISFVLIKSKSLWLNAVTKFWLCIPIVICRNYFWVSHFFLSLKWLF